MTDTLIRSSRDGDLDAIATLYRHHVLHGTASFETEAPSTAEMARRRADLVGRGMPHLVLEQAGRIRGYAYAGPYRPRAAYRDTVENSVYLAADAIGCGFGRQLLAALIEQCTALGLRQMVAVVGDSDNLPSIALHERLGFRRVGTLTGVGFKHGRWLDTVLLQRSLGPGDTIQPIARAE